MSEYALKVIGFGKGQTIVVDTPHGDRLTLTADKESFEILSAMLKKKPPEVVSFHRIKAFEAISLLLHAHVEPMKVEKLQEALFQADLMAFQEKGGPITENSLFPSFSGPHCEPTALLVRTNDIVRLVTTRLRSDAFRVKNQVVTLVNAAAPTKNLSFWEVDTLLDVVKWV